MITRQNGDGETAYSFGPFTLMRAGDELLRDGKPVGLPVQSSKILRLLLENPGRLLSREEICKAVWSDRYVDFDAGLNSEIKKIRRVLDDDAGSPRYIETVPRRGYRFIGELDDVLQAEKSRRSRSKLAMIAIGVALAGVVVFGRLLPPSIQPSSNTAPPVQRPASNDAAQLRSPAYDPHLKGQVALQAGQVGRAEKLFRQAMTVDPAYVPAHIGTARVSVRRRHEGWFRIEAARRFAEKALVLQPDNVEAATIKAGLLLYYYRDHDASTVLINSLLARGADSAGLHVTNAYRLMIGGDQAGALESVGRAYSSDPMSPTLNANYGWIFYKASSLTDAERLCKTSHDLGPQSVFALECVIHVNHSQKDYAEAADYGTRLMKLRGASDDEISAIRGIESGYAREQAYWRWTLAWLLQNQDDTLDALSSTAIAHTILGQQTAAVAAFDAAFKRGGEAFLAFLAIDPRVRELRSHPAFARLAAQSRMRHSTVDGIED